MQNPTHTQTEVKPGIDWAKTCISFAKTVWGAATVVGVPFGVMILVYKFAKHEDTIREAAWIGSFMGFMLGMALTGFVLMHLERKIK
jgi:hypothetical protein